MSLLDVFIKPSHKRERRNHIIQLNNGVKLTATGAVDIVGFHFLPSSFCIEYKSKVIYIDPYYVDKGRKADFIFITHNHFDHMRMNDIHAVLKSNTIIICPKTLQKKLRRYKPFVVKPGDNARLAGVDFKVLPAYSMNSKSHPMDDENVGYIVIVNGVHIYHAGDTYAVPKLFTLKNIDVALLPIAGGNLTMESRDAARLTNSIKPKLVVPIRYRLGKNLTDEFKSYLDDSIDMHVIAR